MTSESLTAAVAAGSLATESAHRALLQSVVDVAWLGGGTLRCTGNSFAAPHVAGISALVLAKHPELTPYQVKTVPRLTATNTEGTP